MSHPVVTLTYEIELEGIADPLTVMPVVDTVNKLMAMGISELQRAEYLIGLPVEIEHVHPTHTVKEIYLLS